MENIAQGIQELQDRDALLEKQNGALVAKRKSFEERNSLRRKRRFGRSGEQSDFIWLQLFADEKEAELSKPEPMEEIAYRCKQKGSIHLPIAVSSNDCLILRSIILAPWRICCFGRRTCRQKAR